MIVLHGTPSSKSQLMFLKNFHSFLLSHLSTVVVLSEIRTFPRFSGISLPSIAAVCETKLLAEYLLLFLYLSKWLQVGAI